jgi:hypothetical protein
MAVARRHHRSRPRHPRRGADVADVAGLELDLDKARDGAAAGKAGVALSHRGDRLAGIRRPAAAGLRRADPAEVAAEIEALAAIPGMSSVLLPLGKLSFYEEFPDATAAAISPFLAEGA